jgi:hypothetical protein
LCQFVLNVKISCLLKSGATNYWNFTQRRKGVSYGRFGTTCRSHLTSRIGPIEYPETSAISYHSTLHRTPKERRCHLYCSGSLK